MKFVRKLLTAVVGSSRRDRGELVCMPLLLEAVLALLYAFGIVLQHVRLERAPKRSGVAQEFVH